MTWPENIFFHAVLHHLIRAPTRRKDAAGLLKLAATALVLSLATVLTFHHVEAPAAVLMEGPGSATAPVGTRGRTVRPSVQAKTASSGAKLSTAAQSMSKRILSDSMLAGPAVLHAHEDEGDCRCKAVTHCYACFERLGEEGHLEAAAARGRSVQLHEGAEEHEHDQVTPIH